MIGFAFRVAALAFVLAALGFPMFVWSLARTSADPGTADAIVALTGGEGRLTAGLDLLDTGKGARLLISGVHAETTREELFAAVGGQCRSRAGVLRRPGPQRREHDRQRRRDGPVGRRTQLSLRHRRHRELSHAAQLDGASAVLAVDASSIALPRVPGPRAA